jgi:ParB-like chromosome segregation protein Spo0J
MSEDLSYIAEDLRPLAVDIDSVHLDPANLRLHDAENVAAIKGSLARFGQRKPIVVNREGSVIEAGNGTWKAAKALDWPKIAAVFVEDDPTTATGYSIADNRAAELARWDYAPLSLVLSEWLKQDEGLLTGTGWTVEDVNGLVAETAGPEEFAEYDEDLEESEAERQAWVTCPECGARFPLENDAI